MVFVTVSLSLLQHYLGVCSHFSCELWLVSVSFQVSWCKDGHHTLPISQGCTLLSMETLPNFIFVFCLHTIAHSYSMFLAVKVRKKTKSNPLTLRPLAPSQNVASCFAPFITRENSTYWTLFWLFVCIVQLWRHPALDGKLDPRGNTSCIHIVVAISNAELCHTTRTLSILMQIMWVVFLLVVPALCILTWSIHINGVAH